MFDIQRVWQRKRLGGKIKGKEPTKVVNHPKMKPLQYLDLSHHSAGGLFKKGGKKNKQKKNMGGREVKTRTCHSEQSSSQFIWKMLYTAFTNSD